MFYKNYTIFVINVCTSEISGKCSTFLSREAKLSGGYMTWQELYIFTCDMFLNNVSLPVGMSERVAVGIKGISIVNLFQLYFREDSLEQLAYFIFVKMTCFLIFMKPVLILYVKWSVNATFLKKQDSLFIK